MQIIPDVIFLPKREGNDQNANTRYQKKQGNRQGKEIKVYVSYFQKFDFVR